MDVWTASLDRMLESWKRQIAVYPDFPKAGVNFLDIGPFLKNTSAWADMISMLGSQASHAEPDAVIGLDARGFIVGSQVAGWLGVPFVMARKPGKLPGELHTVNYDLEYGSNTLCIQKDAIEAGMKVAIIDDLIATGGSIKAAIDLVRMAQAEPCIIGAVIEILELNGRLKFDPSIPVFPVLTF